MSSPPKDENGNYYTPPCAKDPATWDSEDLFDHVYARTLCLESCKALLWCRGEYEKAQRDAQAGRDCGPQGTWAGVYVSRSRQAPRKYKRGA